MIKFAVMTFMFNSWWDDGRMSREKTLEGLARAGAEGVEPFHRDFAGDPDLLKRYRSALNDCGLRVAAVDVMTNLVYADEKQKREGRDELRRGLDICRELDADIAHVAGHKLVGDVSPADGRKMIADGLAESAEEAREAGLVIAVEDFFPSPDLICGAEDCLDVIRMSGGTVKFVFDTGNFIAVGERADEQFDKLAEHIRHCHFKDFAADPSTPRGFKDCDLGDGDIPNATIAQKLIERDYDGWVALETRRRDDIDPVSAIQTEMPLLKSWFGV